MRRTLALHCTALHCAALCCAIRLLSHPPGFSPLFLLVPGWLRDFSESAALTYAIQRRPAPQFQAGHSTVTTPVLEPTYPVLYSQHEQWRYNFVLNLLVQMHLEVYSTSKGSPPAALCFGQVRMLLELRARVSTLPAMTKTIDTRSGRLIPPCPTSQTVCQPVVSQQGRDRELRRADRRMAARPV